MRKKRASRREKNEQIKVQQRDGAIDISYCTLTHSWVESVAHAENMVLGTTQDKHAVEHLLN